MTVGLPASQTSSIEWATVQRALASPRRWPLSASSANDILDKLQAGARVSPAMSPCQVRVCNVTMSTLPPEASFSRRRVAPPSRQGS